MSAMSMNPSTAAPDALVPLPNVNVILDTSGSMRSYKKTIVHHLPLVDKQLREHFDVQYINFSSCVVQYPSVIQCLSGWQGSSTNLVGAFQCLERNREPSTDQMRVVVLISDGEHDHYGVSKSELKWLQGMGPNCVLLTVAVGDHFPTNTVLGDLLSVYQTADTNDLCPVVFTLKSHHRDDELCPDGEKVFSALCTAVMNVGNFVKEVVVHEGSSESDLSIRLGQIVNQTLMRLTKGQRDKGDLAEAIRFETEILQNGINAIVELQQFSKNMKAVNQKAEDHLAKLRSLREQAKAGVSIVNYTEAQRRELAAYGSMQYTANFEGKFCEVGLKRNRGDWGKELDSLIDYMKKFDRFDLSSGSGEVVNVITQESEDEMMARVQLDMANFSAGSVVHPFESSNMSKAEYQVAVAHAIEANRDAIHGAMPHIAKALSTFAIPGFAVCLPNPRPSCFQAEINRAYIRDLCRLMRHTDTASLFKTHLVMKYSGEEINACLPCSKDKEFLNLPFTQKLASYYIFNNVAMSSNLGVVVALQAMAMKMLDVERFMEFEREMIGQLLHMYSLLDIKHQGYMRLMGGEGFRKGLVTVYKTEKGEFHCPDLSKAIFAFLVQRADAFKSVEALKLRRHCTLVEVYASLEAKPSDILFQYLKSYTTFENNLGRYVDFAALCAQYLTKHEVVAAFCEGLYDVLTPPSTFKVEVAMPTMLCDAQSYGRSAASVDRMFRSLGALVGLELPPITPAENVDALLTAARYEGSTQLRAERTVEAVGVSLDDISKEYIAPALVKALMREAPSYADRTYDTWYKHTHEGVHPLPEAYVPLLIEDGIIADVKELALTPSRLSACMCFATGCPHFGKVVGLVQRHPVTGDYLTTPELREHIAIDYVPGYHKAFVQLCTTKTDLEIYNSIKDGTCLYPDERMKEKLDKTFSTTSANDIAALREPLPYEQWKQAFIASKDL